MIHRVCLRRTCRLFFLFRRCLRFHSWLPLSTCVILLFCLLCGAFFLLPRLFFLPLLLLFLPHIMCRHQVMCSTYIRSVCLPVGCGDDFTGRKISLSGPMEKKICLPGRSTWPSYLLPQTPYFYYYLSYYTTSCPIKSVIHVIHNYKKRGVRPVVPLLIPSCPWAELLLRHLSPIHSDCGCYSSSTSPWWDVEQVSLLCV